MDSQIVSKTFVLLEFSISFNELILHSYDVEYLSYDDASNDIEVKH